MSILTGLVRRVGEAAKSAATDTNRIPEKTMRFIVIAMATSRHAARMSPRFPIALLFFIASLASAQTKTQDVVYMKAGGTAFTMDVLRPAKPNKAAVVFVVSGGWISDHSMLKSYEPDLKKGLVDGGFTVFEVVHGAQPRFKVAEILEQVRTAVRFVRAHAADYGIDTNRVGISGISTGQAAFSDHLRECQVPSDSDHSRRQ
jgi:acetyl esterase/lipase